MSCNTVVTDSDHAAHSITSRVSELTSEYVPTMVTNSYYEGSVIVSSSMSVQNDTEEEPLSEHNSGNADEGGIH